MIPRKNSNKNAQRRKKVTCACKNCRKRKSKCSGDEPCERCQRHSLKCEFIKPIMKRGPPKGRDRYYIFERNEEFRHDNNLGSYNLSHEMTYPHSPPFDYSILYQNNNQIYNFPVEGIPVYNFNNSINNYINYPLQNGLMGNELLESSQSNRNDPSQQQIIYFPSDIFGSPNESFVDPNPLIPNNPTDPSENYNFFSNDTTIFAYNPFTSSLV